MKFLSETEIYEILKTSKRIAVVGISENPGRASHQVAVFLKDKGFEIIPVNPRYEEVLGLKCYNSLEEIPGSIDIVDIFLRPESVLPIVEQAVKKKVNVVWMQIGVINHEAAELAVNAGLKVVMDKCTKIEYKNMIYYA